MEDEESFVGIGYRRGRHYLERLQSGQSRADWRRGVFVPCGCGRCGLCRVRNHGQRIARMGQGRVLATGCLKAALVCVCVCVCVCALA